jgi:murein DD-endopeptidase MepM/ murein hydrolase activator NlpD
MNLNAVMNIRRLIITLIVIIVTMTSWGDNKTFTPAERQQIFIATPGLFAKSNSFEIDFTQLTSKDYSYPLPVGKALVVRNGSELQITTKKGDAVKAMFEGDVRLSYKHPEYGNIIVLRHRNGLETVYGDNAQNLVKVGDHVKAGQTIAIVGGVGRDSFCSFAIMVNGRRINPGTVLELNSHRLRKVTLRIRKTGENIRVSVLRHEAPGKGLMAYTGEDAFSDKSSVIINLSDIAANRWAYPLPNAKVISPYGGRRNHSGVDLKTRPNDKVKAAFEGVVIRSSRFSGYGNCIEIKHANGIKTLYSHMSKNLVKVGDRVAAGQTIGLVGRTGRATTEHLHFEICCQGRRCNPARFFDHANHKLKNITVKLTKSGVLTDVK